MTPREVVPVLVVGAGPCGLAAACALLRRGIDVRVLDAGADKVTGSRAIQLWPGALDVLEELGVLADAESLGRRIHAMKYHIAGGRTLTVTLGRDNEPVLLPQELTNELLEKELIRLGGRVERPVRVTEVMPTSNTVSVRTETTEGPGLIHASYLVGADGVHSTVRKRLGIGFPGSEAASPFLIAEGDVSGDYETDTMHYFLGRTGSLVFAPMRGGWVRIGATIGPDTELTSTAVQRLLDERGPGGLRIGKLDVITRFGSHERIATRLHSGRCFLVGDAAHTHAAVGGQGLNLGLQDVRNLVWKLAGVLEGRYRPELLATYEPERRHAAERTLHTTHQYVRMFTLPPAAAVARNVAWRVLDAGGLLRRWFSPMIAGRRLRYPQPGAGTAGSRLRGAGVPRAGARTPAWLLPGDDTSVRFRLCTFGSAPGQLARSGQAFADHHCDQVVHTHLERRRPGFVLLRPDGFVAASGTSARELSRAWAVLAAYAARPAAAGGEVVGP